MALVDDGNRLDNPTQGMMAKAWYQGRVAAMEDYQASANPYPGGSTLNSVWLDGYDARDYHVKGSHNVLKNPYQ